MFIFQILNDRKLEINSFEDQVGLLNDQVKNIERSIGKKSTELQLVQVVNIYLNNDMKLLNYLC